MQAPVTLRVWRRAAWIVAGIVLVAAALWFAAHIPRTISIFLIAAFIAFGVQPIVGRLERRVPKPLAVAIVFFGLLALIAIFLVVVVPSAKRSSWPPIFPRTPLPLKAGWRTLRARFKPISRC